MGFLDGLFGKKPTNPQVCYEDIMDKPLSELLPFMKQALGKSPTGSVSVLVSFQRRLYEIAYWDNHVSDGHRSSAFELAQTLTDSIESGFAGDPDGLEAYRYVVQNLISSSPYGSLCWLITENNIQSDQIIAFASRLENAPLLRKYFEDASASGPEVLRGFIREMLREIINTRRPGGSKNAVLILHGLAVARDATLEAILEPEAISAFRNAHRDYAMAQRKLTDLLVQPGAQGCLSFEPVPSPDALADLVILDMQRVHEGTDEDTDLQAYLDGLSEEDRRNVRFARSIMTLHLAIQQAGSVYGEAFGASLRASFLEKLPRMRDCGLETLLKKVEITEDGTYEEVGFSPDFVFLDEILHMGKEEERTEESFEAGKEPTTMGSNLLSAYRTTFLEYFRYRLRYFAAMERGEPTDRHPGDYADDWLFQPSAVG